MDLQSLAYALTQIVHNFGAVAVVGGAILGRWPQPVPPLGQRRLAWLVLFGWFFQGVSGAGFGAISYLYYGQFPDLHDIAVVALYVKIACAVAGFLLAAAFLRYQRKWSERRVHRIWDGLIVLGVTALVAAAFLRWFS